MIRINVIYENNNISKITVEGHANFSSYGKDIVCAAVSSTYLCTVNAIYLIAPDTIKVGEEKDKQIIEIVKPNDITLKLLTNMLNCLKSLETNYPKNIQIR